MALVYGIHPVIEALKAGKRQVNRLSISKSRKKDLEEILRVANERRVQVHIVDDRQLDQLTSGGNHQGVLLDIESVKEWSLDDALQAVDKLAEQIWVALDEIEDPHNVGAIIRSAAAFGAQAVLIPERRSAGFTPTVEKVAAGGAEVVKIIQVGNFNQALLQLKENGFWIYGAAKTAVGKVKPQSLYVTNFARPTILVIGSEGKGLREKVAEKCDALVFIPQAPGGVESLNASCAASVLLYEISKQSKTCSSCV
jgi:23S rRNA (guanosine2251-2'-O)-methyltransferase